MVATAGAIIKQRIGTFDPSKCQDRYQEALRELIEAKMRGLRIKPRAVAEPPAVAVASRNGFIGLYAPWLQPDLDTRGRCGPKTCQNLSSPRRSKGHDEAGQQIGNRPAQRRVLRQVLTGSMAGFGRFSSRVRRPFDERQVGYRRRLSSPRRSKGHDEAGGGVLSADQSVATGNTVGRRRLPGDPPNVIVSGWQVYDNKGRVIERYEPFFAVGLDYEPPGEAQFGQKATMFYDARRASIADHS